MESFFLRKDAQSMCEEKPRMQFSWHGFGDSAHDPGVELANVSHVGASTGTKLCAHMGAGKMQQRFHNLHRACEKAELKLVRIKNGPVAIHTHAVVKQLLQQQPNGPSRGHNFGFPRRVRCIAWGGQAIGRQERLGQDWCRARLQWRSACRYAHRYHVSMDAWRAFF